MFSSNVFVQLEITKTSLPGSPSCFLYLQQKILYVQDCNSQVNCYQYENITPPPPPLKNKPVRNARGYDMIGE